jgi:hypothetical protein
MGTTSTTVNCESANAGSCRTHSAAGPLGRTPSIVFTNEFEAREIVLYSEIARQVDFLLNYREIQDRLQTNSPTSPFEHFGRFLPLFSGAIGQMPGALIGDGGAGRLIRSSGTSITTDTTNLLLKHTVP